MTKTYVRPVRAGWWYRNPFYARYMLRELSSVFITAYALLLLLGLFRLSQGRAAFAAWLEALATPGALLFHAVTLGLVAYHAWTWFKVMPKTLPYLRVPDRAIVAAGLVAAVVLSALLFWAARP